MKSTIKGEVIASPTFPSGTQDLVIREKIARLGITQDHRLSVPHGDFENGDKVKITIRKVA